MPGIEISALPAAPAAELTDVLPIDQLPGPVTYKLSAQQLLTLFKANGEALTKNDDTNVTLTLTGSSATAVLNAVNIALGWTGQLSPARGGTGINNGTNTITLGGNLETIGAFLATFNFTGTTNVTFPTGGTLATTSQIPSVTPSALTKTDDTNVTLTLGGTPSSALLQAVSLALGWTGQLSVSRGGSGIASATPFGVLCGGTTSTSPFQSLVSIGNIGEVLTSNGPAALPSFQAASSSGIVSSGLINQIAWYAANGTTVSGLTTLNNGVLITSGAGVPSISITLPTAVQSNITQLGAQTQALNMNSNLINNVTDPVSPQDAATMNYVLSYVGGGHIAKNIIIGGDFTTNPCQRGLSFVAVANGAYTADRWIHAYVSTAVGTATIYNVAPPTVAQAGILCTYSYLYSVTTADTSIAAGDNYCIGQRIEGYNFTRIAQQDFTLSFWVRATVTGTYCVSFTNGGGDRSYVAEYTINTTATWEKKTITIPASPAAGTWNYDTGIGLIFNFTLACGSTFQTTPNAWNTGNFRGTSNQVNALATIGNIFQFALVQIEPGTVATPFEIRSAGEELLLCQRYYWKTFPQTTAPAAAAAANGSLIYRAYGAGTGNPGGQYISLPTPMRSSPSATYYAPTIAGATWYNFTGAAASGAPGAIGTADHGFFLSNPQVAADAISNSIGVHVALNAEL